MFRCADMVMLSKADLLPILDDFSPQRAGQYLRNLASSAPLIPVSSKTGDGMDDWLKWLREVVAKTRQTTVDAAAARTHHQHDPEHPKHSQP
jgi:hydrogenase nickel incorporation protein HypB